MANKRMKILVVDDDAAIREVLRIRLESWGYRVKQAKDSGQARELVRSYNPKLVISDVVMPEISGLELLRSLMAEEPARTIVLMTAHGTVDIAVEAIKQGAHDFLTKPLDYSKLKAILEAAESEIQLQHKSTRLASRLEKDSGFGLFVGKSEAMKKVYRLIEKVIPTDVSVLITGESGTGKELAARTIHEKGPRCDGPFVAINAAAIPSELVESEVFGHERGAFTGASHLRQGCFELAHQGTLLLDEIGEMSEALQVKLLRVLEDGRIRRLGGKEELTVDVRVLAATNRDPVRAVQEGQMREDLYYRLNVFTLHLPPLRKRKTDIPLLVQHFVSRFNGKHDAEVQGVREETLEKLTAYPWPGNVRELSNILERAVVLARSRWIETSHLPSYIQKPEDTSKKIVLPLGTSAREAEKELILKTLQETGNNKAETSRRLGVDVKTIRNKLKSYGLM
ncbi:MAG: sigma-54 dependent transcriptional regulator [Acidobacteriota bacterium]|nr:sigma-54 dependent transcriptional regulator [Acidobacteriota bacterium]